MQPIAERYSKSSRKDIRRVRDKTRPRVTSGVESEKAKLRGNASSCSRISMHTNDQGRGKFGCLKDPADAQGAVVSRNIADAMLYFA